MTMYSTVFWATKEAEDDEDEDIDIIREHEKIHYDKNKALCTCVVSCDREDRRESAASFDQIDQIDRQNAVRAILNSMSSLRNVTNNALTDFSRRERKRSRIVTKITATVYFVLGEHVWQSTFCGILQMTKQTVNRIPPSVAGDAHFFHSTINVSRTDYAWHSHRLKYDVSSCAAFKQTFIGISNST